jgi:hypothetical protein
LFSLSDGGGGYDVGITSCVQREAIWREEREREREKRTI